MEKRLRADLLNESVRIGDLLLSKAEHHDSGISWRTIGLKKGKDVESVLEYKEGLYDGVSGIALFLIELYRLTKDEKYICGAIKGMKWADSHTKNSYSTNYALIGGRTGVAYVLVKLYGLINDNSFKESALDIVYSFSGSDETLMDYMNGDAGALLGLAYMYSIMKEPEILKLIDEYIIKVLKRTSFGMQGLCGERTSQSIQSLCGFSHGAAGIGFVFLELGVYFNNPDLCWLAEQYFSYEEQFYEPHANNWRDLKLGVYNKKDKKRFKQAYERKDVDFFTRGSYVNAWCHGAVGIGLTRIRAYQILRKKKYLFQARSAIAATLESNIKSQRQTSFTLCHGGGGNAELFIQAYSVLGKQVYFRYAEEVARLSIKSYRENGYYSSGTRFRNMEDLSLFRGVAGVGYFYLRMLDPTSVSSILMPRLHICDQRVKTGFSASISRSELKSILSKSLFPSTFQVMSRFSVEKEPPLIDSSVHNNISIKSECIILTNHQIQLLDSRAQPLVQDCFDLECMKISLRDKIRSNSLLYFKYAMKVEDAKRILTLDKESLLQQLLILDSNMLIVRTRWKWKDWHLKPHVKDLYLSEDAKNTLLLIPFVDDIKEVYLSPVESYILNGFAESSNIKDVIAKVLWQVRGVDSQNRSYIEETVFKHICRAVEKNVLIDPMRHV